MHFKESDKKSGTLIQSQIDVKFVFQLDTKLHENIWINLALSWRQSIQHIIQENISSQRKIRKIKKHL